MDAQRFSACARAVQDACHELGLRCPALRTDGRAHRVVRHYPRGDVVVVDRHHPDDEVIGAMIDGVIHTNPSSDPDPVADRAVLLQHVRSLISEKAV